MISFIPAKSSVWSRPANVADSITHVPCIAFTSSWSAAPVAVRRNTQAVRTRAMSIPHLVAAGQLGEEGPLDDVVLRIEHLRARPVRPRNRIHDDLREPEVGIPSPVLAEEFQDA